jgi:aryl-alcohol dehydrogenase-like predicted oxidoreductase
MQYRKLGKSDVLVSEIGCGCWPIGGGWGADDDDADVASMKFAFEHGVTFFDTAMGYAAGHSEELLGQAFRDMRDEVVIATKISPKSNPGGTADEVYPYDWVIECTEASLRRLGTDCIDVQQIHCWRDQFTDAPGWHDAMLNLQDEGKIRHIGVSAEDWEWNGSARITESGRVSSVQAIYNVFDQQPEQRLFPVAIENNVGIIVRVPLFEGLLAGTIRPGQKFVEGDWRGKFLNAERLEEASPRLDALAELCNDDCPTLAALSLKFCLGHPAVSTVIVGMRNPRHVEANCAVSDGKPLSSELAAALKAHAWNHNWVYPWCE